MSRFFLSSHYPCLLKFGIVVSASILHGCSAFQQAAKNDFTDGFYLHKSDSRDVFVRHDSGTTFVYDAKKIGKVKTVDTLQAKLVLPDNVKANDARRFLFVKRSPDIDFLTIPFKFRGGRGDVPPQLNTNLNGAVYLGARTDRYSIFYRKDPLGIAQRQISHTGFSFGVFAGFGNTFMSPTNTQNVLQQEYDGVVLTKGLAAIVAVERLTVGLSLGYDHLLDRNHDIWIYQKKPWLGLALGLNLN